MTEDNRAGIGRVVLISLVIVILVVVAFGIAFLTGNIGAGSSTSIETLPGQLFQKTGTVDSAGYDGGNFSIPNIALANQSNSVAIGTMEVGLTPSQVSLVHSGENLEVQMNYTAQQRVLFETLGKVVSVSNNDTVIALLNSSVPTAVPSSWGPRVGNKVVLTIGLETETPLIVITGLQSNSSNSRYPVGVYSPACLTQTDSTVSPIQSVCVLEALGQHWTVEFVYGNPPPHTPLLTLESVTTTDSGFSVSSFRTGSSRYFIGTNVTVTLKVPNTDFIGDIQFYFKFT